MISAWHFRPIFKGPARLVLVCISGLLSACSGVLFYPDKQHYLTPDQLGLDYRDVTLAVAPQVSLHGWFLPARGRIRGTVLHLHGNAENISTHIHSVAWLPARGYQVLLLDYRGYGRSTGKPDIEGALADIDAAFQWLLRQPDVRQRPLYLLGQSLGATLAAYYVGAHATARERLSGLVLDAPFASYRTIAREKLAELWLTWPLQYPLSWLLPERYSPLRNAAKLAPLPVLVIASHHDQVVPARHSRCLFRALAEPKQWLWTDGPHIATFANQGAREALLTFFAAMDGGHAISAVRAGEE